MMSNAWLTALKEKYPTALPYKTLATRAIAKLQTFGFTKENTLFTNSTCRDEINDGGLRLFKDAYGKQFFDFTGLGGFPNAGLTGFGAMSHHVPDGGNILIIYGSHIGVSASGELGKVLREGMSHETTSCGALCALVNKVETDSSYMPLGGDPLDAEQTALETAVLNAPSKLSTDLVEATKLLYTVIDSTMSELVSRSDVSYQVAMIGGIHINTPIDEQDYFEVKDARIINYNNEKGRKHMWVDDLLFSGTV